MQIQNALYGHRLCETDKESVAINGITLGTDYPEIDIKDHKIFSGPIASETYHPNALGHVLLEAKLLAVTHNLTDTIPTNDLNAAPPSKNNLEFLQVPHTGRAINNIFFDDDMVSDTVIKNSITDLTVNGLDYSLKSNTNYRIEVHSDPTVLGTSSTNSYGNLDQQIQIPASLSAGMHTLHVYGSNLAGEPIDINKTIYVAASKNDWDGDRIPQILQTCIIGDASGQDYNQDGIDDACDGDIATPPVPAITGNQ